MNSKQVFLPCLKGLFFAVVALIAEVSAAHAGEWRIGISVGFRTIVGKTDKYYEATINPTNNTVQLDPIDKGAALISTTLSYFRDHSNWGPMLVVNLTEFGGAQNGTVFNKSIEGGFGLTYKIDDLAAVGLNWEKAVNQLPRQSVIDAKNQQLKIGTEVQTALDPRDSRFFRSDALDAVSLRLIYLTSATL